MHPQRLAHEGSKRFFVRMAMHQSFRMTVEISCGSLKGKKSRLKKY